MKIKFVSDFFVNEIIGGAELADDYLIMSLSQHKDIERVKSIDFVIDNTDFYIVSNFTLLSETHKNHIMTKDYVIVEHDHKYLKTRNPSLYKNRMAPADQLINAKFYRNARVVFCQSKGHAETVRDNLILDNVANFGCSFWSEQHLSILEEYSNQDKEFDYSFLNSANKIKGTIQANRFCVSKSITPHIIEPSPFKDMVSELSKTDKLIFFPQVYESFCRLVVEARALNCSVISNKNLGCLSEEWFRDYKGKELIEFIRQKQSNNIDEFIKVLEGNKTSLLIDAKQYPKVSIITSMFKGEKYINNFLKNITNQTVFEHCEFIIIDAASPENEYQTIKGYLDKYPNIIYRRLKEDPGIYGTWNEAIRMASGEYITNANLDDSRSLEQIEIMVNCLEKNPDIDLAYSESYVTQTPNETFYNNTSNGISYPITDFSKQAMVKCLPGCMPVWRRSMHDKYGFFDESYKYAGDHEMWLRAVRGGAKFKRVNGIHGLYCMNPSGLSTAAKNKTQIFKEEQKVFWEYTDIFGRNTTDQYREYFSQ